VIPDVGAAVLDAEGRYRYVLRRRWAPEETVLWIMLNPSTADATSDDPTIRRCRSFSRRWGYGALAVVNLFSYRSTDPKALRARAFTGGRSLVVGPETDAYIRREAAAARMIVAAWGTRGAFLGRGQVVLALLEEAGWAVHCLGTTRGGHPQHPLYVPGNARPRIFKGHGT
jgi:hypothetical protein